MLISYHTKGEATDDEDARTLVTDFRAFADGTILELVRHQTILVGLAVASWDLPVAGAGEPSICVDGASLSLEQSVPY